MKNSTQKCVSDLVRVYRTPTSENGTSSLKEKLEFCDTVIIKSLGQVDYNRFCIAAALGGLQLLFKYYGTIDKYNNIYDYAMDKYNLGRTSVKNALNVFGRYFDQETGQINLRFQEYCFSQLVEMLPFMSYKIGANGFIYSPEMCRAFNHSMSIREMRRIRLAIGKCFVNCENWENYTKYLSDVAPELPASQPQTEAITGRVEKKDGEHVFCHELGWEYANALRTGVKANGKKLTKADRIYYGAWLDCRTKMTSDWEYLKEIKAGASDGKQSFQSRSYTDDDLVAIFGNNDIEDEEGADAAPIINDNTAVSVGDSE